MLLLTAVAATAGHNLCTAAVDRRENRVELHAPSTSSYRPRCWIAVIALCHHDLADITQRRHRRHVQPTRVVVQRVTATAVLLLIHETTRVET